MSATTKEILKPDLKQELFSFLQRDFTSRKLACGELVHGQRMKSLEAVSFMSWTLKSAQLNNVSELLNGDDGGYQVLSVEARAAYEFGALADPPLANNATDAAKEKFNKSLTRMSNSNTALTSDRAALRKRSDEAGFFMSKIVLPGILPAAIRPFEAKWAKEVTQDHFANLKEILSHVQSFQQPEKISEELDALFQEISVVKTHSELSVMLSQFEKIYTLQKDYLTKPGVNGIGRIPLDINYPPKTGDYFLKKMVKKVAEQVPVLVYRAFIQRWTKSLPKLISNLRNQLIQYIPNEPVVPVRANLAGESRIVTVDNVVYQEPAAFDQHNDTQVQPLEYIDQSQQSHDQGWYDEYDCHSDNQILDRPVQAYVGSIRYREEQADSPHHRRRTNVCPHYEMGNCRFGDQCVNIHDPNEVMVKMSPADHQQWQLQQLNNVNRNQRAMMTQQQGSAPSMHPTGMYRPPLPMEPFSHDQLGRGYHSGRGGRSGGSMSVPSRMVTYDQQPINHGGQDPQHTINYGGRGGRFSGRGDYRGGRGIGGRGRY